MSCCTFGNIWTEVDDGNGLKRSCLGSFETKRSQTRAASSNLSVTELSLDDVFQQTVYWWVVFNRLKKLGK